MTNDTVSSGFAAAEAAYTTWQQEVKVHAEPLGKQAPDVQARWLRIAEAARSTPATGNRNDNDQSLHHTMTPFHEPLDDTQEAGAGEVIR